VGPGVDPARVGEHVVLTFAPACGRCRFCLAGRINLCVEVAAGFETGRLRDGTTRLSLGGETVYHLAFVSSFARHAVVPANAALPVPQALDPSLTCLLGCGVTTGVAAVTRLANVRPADSVAVFGCGGVGLSAIQGARLVSAHPIVAVDPVSIKRQMALALGASHALDPAARDVVATIQEIVPGGVEHAFEAIGKPEVAAQAFAATATGGTTVLIGQPAVGVQAGFPVYDLTQFEHRILGTHIGGATPALDVPRLATLLAAGRLDLATMVTHRFRLEQINEAIALVGSGQAGRVVIDFSEGR
jgi:Zn-dependent alcohol dehydrogenase